MSTNESLSEDTFQMKNKQTWVVPASDFARRCRNPIRELVEGLDLSPNPDKPMIALSIGDPTLFGNLKTANEAIEAVVDSVKSYKSNGYAPSTGHTEAREAVANYISQSGEKVGIKDVVICSGCSYALEMCITVLANPGQNILVPKPGFPIYRMIADCLGIHCKYYNLLPEQNWKIDLDQLESLVDKNTAAIVINNPSNPCGSVFSKRHLMAILDIASRHCIPIISDEVYENFVFKGRTFHSLGSLSVDVPILTCGGLTKRFLVPGWRLGWIIIHDRNNAFYPQIYKGLLALSQRIMGSNTLIQGALPAILTKTPAHFFEDTVAIVENNAKIAYGVLSKTPGLKPVMPAGAMYMMVGLELKCFPEFENDLELVERMVSEQSIFCLPGMAFELPGYVRIVLTIPETLMEVACDRIKEFCLVHYRPEETTTYVSRTTTERTLELQVLQGLNGESEKYHLHGFHENTEVNENYEEEELELSKG